MQFNHINLLAITAGLLGAHTAFAAEPASTGTGYYMGLSAGSATFKSPDTKQKAGAAKIEAGYMISPNFSVEAAATTTGSAEQKDSFAEPVSGLPANATMKVKGKAVEIKAVGILPLSDDFSLKAKVGVASLTNQGNMSVAVAGHTVFEQSQKQRVTTPLVSMGAAYQATRDLTLVADYQVYTKPVKFTLGDSTIDVKNRLFTVGAQYKF